MTRNLLEEVKATSIYPDHLMSGIAKSIMPLALAISLGAHVLVLGLTSVRFVSLCMEHKTLHPKSEIKFQEEQRRQAEVARLREERLAASRAETEARQAAAAAQAPAATQQPAEGTGLTPIEQAIQEVDMGRPEPPRATFETIDQL